MCKEMLFTKSIDVKFLTFSIIVSHTVKQVIVYLDATAEDKFSIMYCKYANVPIY